MPILAVQTNAKSMTIRQIQKRLCPKFVVTKSGCWEWKGHIGNDGYAKMTWKAKTLRVHRVMYALTKGEPDTTMVCDHLCRNIKCINPQHIELVTQLENNLRGKPYRDKKTYCPIGHRLINPYIEKAFSTPRCRICRNEVAKARYRRLRRERSIGKKS